MYLFCIDWLELEHSSRHPLSLNGKWKLSYYAKHHFFQTKWLSSYKEHGTRSLVESQSWFFVSHNESGWGLKHLDSKNNLKSAMIHLFHKHCYSIAWFKTTWNVVIWTIFRCFFAIFGARPLQSPSAFIIWKIKASMLKKQKSYRFAMTWENTLWCNFIFYGRLTPFNTWTLDGSMNSEITLQALFWGYYWHAWS